MLGDLQSPPWLWVPNWSPRIYSQKMRIILIMCLYSNYKWFFIEINFRYSELKMYNLMSFDKCVHSWNEYSNQNIKKFPLSLSFSKQSPLLRQPLFWFISPYQLQSFKNSYKYLLNHLDNCHWILCPVYAHNQLDIR